MTTPSSSRIISGRRLLLGLLGVGLALPLACEDGGGDGDDGGSACGPTQGEVTRVIDGDTVEIEDAEGETHRIRYLMIDTPESTTEQECWGEEAKAANEALVEGQTVQLSYDVECTDKYDRLLAYVSLGGQVINEVMVERGHACVLHIPPNGEDVVDTYESLEYEAQMFGKGLWAACDPIPCG